MPRWSGSPAARGAISSAPLPWATIGTIVWIVIAYYFNQSMIDALTGGHEVTRTEQPRLYNLLENLCISRGITMPKLKLIDDDPALNAFATGMNQRQYSITVTSGLLRASTMRRWRPCSGTSSPISVTATFACWWWR